jgi:hypothetical protein
MARVAIIGSAVSTGQFPATDPRCQSRGFHQNLGAFAERERVRSTLSYNTRLMEELGTGLFGVICDRRTGQAGNTPEVTLLT